MVCLKMRDGLLFIIERLCLKLDARLSKLIFINTEYILSTYVYQFILVFLTIDEDVTRF